ncbi:MAG: DUF2799 domain-containing protein [Silicimonas sp.]|nr:DUF2799 domain-containing protein [Silicimonas sp.]
MKHLLAVILLVPLVGCATLSEDQCRNADWETIGKRDGSNGRLPDWIEKHAHACNQYGIAPVRATWEKGRQQGLPLYCTPSRAWEEGADGKRLSPVCPADNLSELRRLNQRGLVYHRIGRDIEEAAREIDRINATISDLPASDSARASLASERASLRLEILTLRAERSLYRY